MSNCSYFGGIDIAKNHFSIHVVDSNGKVTLHKSVTRPKLLTTIANMPPMRIGLEACGGAHFLKRLIQEQQGLFDKSLVSQRRAVGCGETAIRESLYVFVVSHV
ncbi:putative Transposase and inactivated derivative [Vibrio nigripulchritudo]|uniref:Putative Transposase and inactivated derivative n=1 Tax=Vibrio nigripulchritudo TaxID=28173 RepID=U4KIA9_9VIBR|nr:putative Transposase and inactivated derivative [Vibrio nigripulchritudo]